MNAKVTELQLKYDTETKQEQINQLTVEQQSQTQKYLLAGLGILHWTHWLYGLKLSKTTPKK